MRNLKKIACGLGVASLALSACTSGQQETELTASGLNPAAFDSTINGKKTALYALKNANGMEVCITNFGGRVVSIMVPDKDGKLTDVVLGYDNVAQYVCRRAPFAPLCKREEASGTDRDLGRSCT